MKSSSHFHQNFHLAYPVMLSQLGHVVMGITDSVMVGHLGAGPLAASSLANVAFNVLLLFGIGVSYAITPLVSAAHGKDDSTAISSILRHGLVINLVNGLLLVILVIAAKNILFHIGQPAEVVTDAVPYLGIITFSIVPALVFQTFRQFSEGLSRTQIPMTVMIIANVLHVGLNYLFIYGHGGFPAMGLTGAGWATLTSRIFMAAAIAGYIYFAPTFKKFRDGFSTGAYSNALITKMLHIGIPSGVQFIFKVAAFDFSAVMMGWLGTKALAAHQIAINLATISYMTTSGLAAAATIRVSYELGKGDIVTLRKAANNLLGMALVFMSCWGVLFLFAKNLLPALYIDDPNVLAIAAPLVVIAGFFQLSDGAQVVCAGALRGLRDVKIPSLFVFIAYWIIGLPMGYWLAFKIGFGPIGIWTGLLIGLTLTALAMFFRFRRLTNKLKGSRAAGQATIL